MKNLCEQAETTRRVIVPQGDLAIHIQIKHICFFFNQYRLVEASSASGQVDVVPVAPPLDQAPPEVASDDEEVTVCGIPELDQLHGAKICGTIGNLCLYRRSKAKLLRQTAVGQWSELEKRLEVFELDEKSHRTQNLVLMYANAAFDVPDLFDQFTKKMEKYECVFFVGAVPEGRVVYMRKMDYKQLPVFNYCDSDGTIHIPKIYRFKKMGLATVEQKHSLCNLMNVCYVMRTNFLTVSPPQAQNYSFQQILQGLARLPDSDILSLKVPKLPGPYKFQ